MKRITIKAKTKKPVIVENSGVYELVDSSGISWLWVIGNLLFGFFAAMAIVSFTISIIDVVRKAKHGENGLDGVTSESRFILSMYAENVSSGAGINYFVPFTHETIDTGEFHNDTFNSQRMSITEITTGYYLIQANFQFEKVTDEDGGDFQIVKNAGTVVASEEININFYSPPNSIFFNIDLSIIDKPVPGDYYRIRQIIKEIGPFVKKVTFTATYQGPIQ